MKKLLLFTLPFLLASIITGCTVQIPHIPSIKYTESVDYSRFPGFFITESNSVSFEYQPVASVTTTHIQGVEGKTLSIWTLQEVNEAEERKNTKFKDDVYGSNNNKVSKASTEKVEIVTLEGTLEDIVNESKKLNANGIINLRIKPITDYDESTIITKGYEISGMAIKR